MKKNNVLLKDLEVFLRYLISVEELDKNIVRDTAQKLLTSLIFSKQND